LIATFDRVHLVTAVKYLIVLTGGELRWVYGGHSWGGVWVSSDTGSDVIVIVTLVNIIS